MQSYTKSELGELSWRNRIIAYWEKKKGQPSRLSLLLGVSLSPHEARYSAIFVGPQMNHLPSPGQVG